MAPRKWLRHALRRKVDDTIKWRKLTERRRREIEKKRESRPEDQSEPPE